MGSSSPSLRQGIYPEIDPKNFENAFKDKVVLVTGSSRGIGKAIALAFANSGATVAVTGRDRGEVESTTREVLSSGKNAKAIGVVADCRKRSDLERLVGEVREPLKSFSGEY
jgi:NAD(P)-dependent dehydrogenase (short-subunit alcohol dehydrogenase family)